MDITDQVARAYGSTPFDVLVQDAEHVIMLINYLVEKAEYKQDSASNASKPAPKQKDDFWNF